MPEDGGDMRLSSCFVALLFWSSSLIGQAPPSHLTSGPPVPPTPVEAAVKAAYQREFGETIARPAIYNNPQAVDCSGNGHLTTTAYVRAGTTTTLLSMYMSRDGTGVTRRSRSALALAPAGTIRILVVLIRYPETVSANALTLWEDAQKQINDDHAAFASSRGYRAPVV